MKEVICPVCGHKFNLRSEFDEVVICPKCKSEVDIRKKGE